MCRRRTQKVWGAPPLSRCARGCSSTISKHRATIRRLVTEQSEERWSCGNRGRGVSKKGAFCKCKRWQLTLVRCRCQRAWCFVYIWWLQTALRVLDLSENNATNFSLAGGGVLALASAIEGHPTLVELNISHNRVDRGTIESLAGALGSNTVLTSLHLEDNSVDPKVRAGKGHCQLTAVKP